MFMSVIGKITPDTKDFPQGLVLDARIPLPGDQVWARVCFGPCPPGATCPPPERAERERERERETERERGGGREGEGGEVDECLFLEPKTCVRCSLVLIDSLFSPLFKQPDLSDASRTFGCWGRILRVPIPAQQPTPPPRHTYTLLCTHWSHHTEGWELGSGWTQPLPRPAMNTWAPLERAPAFWGRGFSAG